MLWLSLAPFPSLAIPVSLDSSYSIESLVSLKGIGTKQIISSLGFFLSLPNLVHSLLAGFNNGAAPANSFVSENAFSSVFGATDPNNAQPTGESMFQTYASYSSLSMLKISIWVF